MNQIEFEEPEISVCECCGRASKRLTRFVTRNGDAFAVYYVKFTEGHDNRKAYVMVGFGDWDDNALPDEARTSFTYEIWLADDAYQLSLIDPDQSPWDTGYLGHRLSAIEARAHPLLQEVFDLSDHIVRCDESLVAYLDQQGS
jgi:hypothetical protein